MKTRVVVLGVSLAVSCGYPQPSPFHVDSATADDSPPSSTVTLSLPPYMDLNASASWSATVQGPANAAFSFAWQSNPGSAATFQPASGATSLDASGSATMTGTVTAGTSAATANVQLQLTGETVGSGNTAIQIVTFQIFGDRSPFASSTDTSLVANRVFASPVAIPQGLEVIAFGMRDGSVASDVKMGVYATSGSQPGGLLVSSPVFHAVPGETLQFLASPQTLTAPGAYVALIAATDVSIPINANSAQNVLQFTQDIPFASALPSSFVQMASFMGGAPNVFVVAITP